ncbi:hypothetical protein BDW59DRAFT_141282 [Aspergillus cavernicola]|uniref:Uncharacterized protein n=1 Tax=Aspergillus cavernicola TaxID=176166 RepID=A0ABR4ISK1_9EURO
MKSLKLLGGVDRQFVGCRALRCFVAADKCLHTATLLLSGLARHVWNCLGLPNSQVQDVCVVCGKKLLSESRQVKVTD